MAENKGVAILNRGKRHFQVSGNRRIAPGEIFTATVAESEALLVYGDLADVSKLPLKAGEASAKLVADNAKLLAENAALKKQMEGRDGDEDTKKKAK